jgi:hypothetical protein
MFGGGVSFGGGAGGAPGADGNTVLYGAGAPAALTGVNGNFYIDTVAHAIYGPKAGGSWGSSTSLVGPSGSNGSSGIIYGNGAPSNATGADGTYYVDNTAHTLYGPKAAGAWPAGVSLVGPTGAQGDNAIVNMMVFGDGSDGDLTVNTSVQLQRDMFYNNLTLGASGKIATNGYRLHVNGILDLSNAAAGAINNSATDASQTFAGQSTTYNNPIPAPGQGNDLMQGNSGPTSQAGTTGVGAAGVAPSSILYSMGGQGGDSGAGGASGTPNAGGAKRVPGGHSAVVYRRFDWRFHKSSSMIYGGQAGACGGIGGGDGTNASNASPLAGVGAGWVWVAARTLKRGASTAAGAIASKGGAAANVTTPLQVGTIGGTGGGGGGGGGVVILAYQTLSGSAVTNLLDVSGGKGGDGLPGFGTGKGGQGGTGGNNGTIIVHNFTTMTTSYAVSPGSLPSQNAAPTTVAGSAGTAGASGTYTL